MTNYGGLPREIIKIMIARLGGRYTSTLSASNNVLICSECVNFFYFTYICRPRGPKYEMAQTLNINVVNHLWLEDCWKHWELQSFTRERYLALLPSLSAIVGQTPIGQGTLRPIEEADLTFDGFAIPLNSVEDQVPENCKQSNAIPKNLKFNGPAFNESVREEPSTPSRKKAITRINSTDEVSISWKPRIRVSDDESETVDSVERANSAVTKKIIVSKNQIGRTYDDYSESEVANAETIGNNVESHNENAKVADEKKHRNSQQEKNKPGPQEDMASCKTETDAESVSCHTPRRRKSGKRAIDPSVTSSGGSRRGKSKRHRTEFELSS